MATYETAGAHVLAAQAPTRYAVRQVLDQELYKTMRLRESAARQARFQAGKPVGAHDELPFDDKENKAQQGRAAAAAKEKAAEAGVRRDFFGRVVVVVVEAGRPLQDVDANASREGRRAAAADGGVVGKAWVTFHEGLNNAVKKPISLEEFLRGF